MANGHIHFARMEVYWGLIYRHDPKYLDGQVWANSVDQDQTAVPRAILSESFGCISCKTTLFKF